MPWAAGDFPPAETLPAENTQAKTLVSFMLKQTIEQGKTCLVKFHQTLPISVHTEQRAGCCRGSAKGDGPTLHCPVNTLGHLDLRGASIRVCPEQDDQDGERPQVAEVTQFAQAGAEKAEGDCPITAHTLLKGGSKQEVLTSSLQ